MRLMRQAVVRSDSSGETGKVAPVSERPDSAGKRRVELLKEVLRGNQRVWILTHDNPDPDCMAGGLALLALLREGFGLDASIVYGGIIGRAANRGMVRLLEIPMRHIETLAPRPEERFICVDTQPSFTNNSLPDGADVAAVIDHHPLETDERVPFVDVRPGYGAVASMTAEYLLDAGQEITPPLATAIAFGIASETEDLEREASEGDLAAYVQVLPRVDHRLLGQLRHPKIERAFFQTLAGALQGARSCHDVVMCHMDAINVPDEVAQVADILNSLAGSTWVLCTGEYEGSLIVSLRSSDNSASAGRVLERALAGKGNAGGHGMIAGGRVPLDADSDREQICRELTEAVLAALGYEKDSPLEPLLPAAGEDGARTNGGR